MVIALTLFILAFLGIVALFVHKAWELRTDRVIAPTVRERIDERAAVAKNLLQRGERELRKLPPATMYFMRVFLHDAALGAAALARFLERQSHRLADLVSHKRGFERRETQSEFLKSVSDYKSAPLDVEDESSYSA